MSRSQSEKSRKTKAGNLAQPTPQEERETEGGAMAERGAGEAANTDGDKLSQILSKMNNLDGIKTSIGELREDMDEIKKELVAVKGGIGEVNGVTASMDAKLDKELSEIRIVLKTTKEELASNRIKLAITTQQLAASKRAHQALAVRVTSLENRSRQCNVIMDGIMESDGENLRDIVMDIGNQICPGAVKIEEVTGAYRIGKRVLTGGRAKRTRPIMVNFRDVRTRNAFYYARTKLKDNGELKGIYLNDDVTIETKRARDDLRSVANMARSAGANVRVHDDGIVLNGTKYRLFETETLPAEFALSKAKTVRSENGIFFHSESSFLSNFYPSTVWADEYAYPTAEHCYQAAKCKMAGDLDLMKRVQTAQSPLEAKKMADTVQDSADWNNKRDTVMREIIDAKFEQSSELAKRLIDTGEAKLYEATMNTHFGIGATLHSKEVRDMSFKGLNKLGELLQAKRDDLLATLNTQTEGPE